MIVIRPRRDPIQNSAALAATIKSWRAGLSRDEIELGQMLIIEPIDRKECIFEIGPASSNQRLLVAKVEDRNATWLAAVDFGGPFDPLSEKACQRLEQFHALIREHGQSEKDFRFLSAPAAEALAIERGQRLLEPSPLSLSAQINALQRKAGSAALSALSVRELVLKGHEEIRRAAIERNQPEI